jgi:hypothetical protein
MEARMAIADILLCIDPTTVDDGRLKLAVNLAQAHKAHLNTCYIMPEERGALIGTGIALCKAATSMPLARSAWSIGFTSLGREAKSPTTD